MGLTGFRQVTNAGHGFVIASGGMREESRNPWLLAGRGEWFLLMVGVYEKRYWPRGATTAAER
jgi:hypothetical protein